MLLGKRIEEVFLRFRAERGREPMDMVELLRYADGEDSGAVDGPTAFTELRARLYTATLELFDEPTLLAELRRRRSRYTAGSATVVNPRVGGSHGDSHRRSRSRSMSTVRARPRPLTAKPRS